MLLLESVRFPFRSYVQVFSRAISPICISKYPYSCFYSNFCFLVIVVPLIFMLTVLFLVAVINLSLFIFMLSSSPCIDTSMLLILRIVTWKRSIELLIALKCLEVRESGSFHVHVYLFLKSFFLSIVLSNTNNFPTDLFHP